MGWRIFVQDEPWAMRSSLYIADDRGGVRSVVKPWTLEVHNRAAAMEASAKFDEGEVDELLQAFSDLAWERGIRPTQIEDQRNQVKAMEGHLGDLRKVSFKLLKIDA